MAPLWVTKDFTGLRLNVTGLRPPAAWSQLSSSTPPTSQLSYNILKKSNIWARQFIFLKIMTFVNTNKQTKGKNYHIFFAK